MYVVKTYLAPSPIQGVGVFAGEDVPKGKIVWEFTPEIDRILDQQTIDALPERCREHIKKHAFWSDGKAYLCTDTGQFTNHSENPNVGSLPGATSHEVALRDIRAGEEITSDYRTFDDQWREKLGL